MKYILGSMKLMLMRSNTFAPKQNEKHHMCFHAITSYPVNVPPLQV